MTVTTASRHLSDTATIAAAATPIIGWFTWYADPHRTPTEGTTDLARHLQALAELAPLTGLGGPIGEAAAVLLDGGLGHTSAEILKALDTLDAVVNLDRCDLRPWHANPAPEPLAS